MWASAPAMQNKDGAKRDVVPQGHLFRCAPRQDAVPYIRYADTLACLFVGGDAHIAPPCLCGIPSGGQSRPPLRTRAAQQAKKRPAEPVFLRLSKKPVIASQCSHWRGNPFLKRTNPALFAGSCLKRYGFPRRFAPRSKCPWGTPRNDRGEVYRHAKKTGGAGLFYMQLFVCSYASMPRLVRYFLTIRATLKVMASSNSRRSRPVSFLIFSSR